MKSILEASQAIKDQIIEDRHNLHRRPEFGFDMPETAAYVQKRLAEMGIESQPCGGPIDPDLRKKFTFAGFPDMENSTGVVATIGKGEPCILLRADMDALPMQEAEGLVDFVSENREWLTCAVMTPIRRCCWGLQNFSKTEKMNFAAPSS